MVEVSGRTVELIFSHHALLRMYERKIGRLAVRHLADSGEVIENYPDDRPFPSRLVLGFPLGRPLHAVLADGPKSGQNIVVTIYEPNLAEWEPGFRKRRRP